MPSPAFQPETYTKNSAVAAGIALDQAHALQALKHRAVRLDVDQIGDYLAPVMPGQYVALIGQTSHWKTGFLRMWQNSLSNQLIEERRNAAIMDISLEDTLEERMWQEIVRVSKVDMRKLVTGNIDDWAPIIMAVTKISSVPIIRIAYSLRDQPEKRQLNITNVGRCIEYACKTFDITDVAGIYLDYLQALESEDGPSIAGVNDQRRLRVRSDNYAFRRICGHYLCPGFLGVQAKQELSHAYSSKILLPGVYDGEETSSIGQHADRVITLWMPKQTPQIGKTVDWQGQVIHVTDNLIFVWVAKQRGNLPSGKVFPCRIDYPTQTLAPIE